jgi:hypothetical protein
MFTLILSTPFDVPLALSELSFIYTLHKVNTCKEGHVRPHTIYSETSTPKRILIKLVFGISVPKIQLK